MRHRRRGFLFTMPLMLGMGILLFASMIAISQMFVTIGGPMIPDLLADMPTIFHYVDGQRMPHHLPLFTESLENDSDSEFTELFPAISMYVLMVKIALGIFVVLLMLAGISYFFEEFNIVRQGTAYGLVAKMMVLVPLYLTLPYLWDMVALVIESSSLYLMDPFGRDPHMRTTELWCKVGSAVCSIDGTTTINPIDVFEGTDSFDRESALAQDAWNNSLQDPFFGEDFVINVLLSLFKGFAVMFMTAMMFVLSAIRVLLIEVIVIAFPLVTAIGLIPWINTRRISDMFQQNLIGLSVAPIMSAISLSVGISTIDAQNMPPLRMWFQMLSIGFIAIFFPVMLSPMLGNISTRVGSMISTSITSASMAGSTALKGATQGISQASSLMGSRGVANAMLGTGSGPDGGPRRFHSADVGAATSDASPGRGLSAMDKLMMYGKAGAIGMMGGLGSGMIQSMAQGMRVGNMTTHVSDKVMHMGDSRIGQIVSNTAMSGVANMAAEQMVGIENFHFAENPDPQITQSTLMNPGSHLNSMASNSDSFDAGQVLARDPDARQEFVRLFGETNGMDGMSLATQQKLGQQISEQINMHPNAAGKIFLDLKSERLQDVNIS